MNALINRYLYDRRGEEKLAILRSPLFLSVLVLKLAAMALFASHYLYSLFVPFVKYFVLSGFADPYTHFLNQGLVTSFPYPAVMLWTLSAPLAAFRFLLGTSASVVGPLDIFLIRLPILAADLVIFLILARWLKNNQRSVLLYYWCSPILFYINYLHGQLDALPVMLLFVFLYFLFKEQFYTAVCFLGLSLAAKTTGLVVLPFVFIYLLAKRLPARKIVAVLLLPAGIWLLTNLAYLSGPGFAELVLKTKEQFKVFDFQFRLSDNFTLYIVPLAYLFLLVKSLTYKTFNRDIFLMFLGFAFGLLTIFIPPMPGWYYFVVPFLIYFFARADRAPRFLFLLLNLLYFAYFLSIKSGDLFEIFRPIAPAVAAWPNLYAFLSAQGFDSGLLANIIFSLLQGSMILAVWWIYREGEGNYLRHKIYYAPYLIGIAGDSGSGKSTVAQALANILGRKNVSIVEGDDLHKWERGDPMWQKYTHLDPRANFLHDELLNAKRLKNGEAALRRHYDHDTGKFTLPAKYDSKRIIVFEGLHSLYLGKMRQTLDLKIFMNPDRDLRLHWKIVRDRRERGYSKDEVLKQLAKRETDSKQFIEAQKKFSDLEIAVKNRLPLGESLGEDDALLAPYLEFTSSNDINLKAFLDAVALRLGIDYLITEEKQTIRLEGELSAAEIGDLANILIPELDELSAGLPQWKEGIDGIIQLFVCYYIFEKMRQEKNDR